MAAAAARTNSGGGGGDSLKLTTAAVVLGAVISQTRLAETHLLSTKPICSRPLCLSLWSFQPFCAIRSSVFLDRTTHMPVEEMTMLTCITMIKQRQEAAISGGRSHSYSVRSISAEATKGPGATPSQVPDIKSFISCSNSHALRFEYCNSFNLPKIYCICQRRNVCLSEIMKFM